MRAHSRSRGRGIQSAKAVTPGEKLIARALWDLHASDAPEGIVADGAIVDRTGRVGSLSKVAGGGDCLNTFYTDTDGVHRLYCAWPASGAGGLLSSIAIPFTTGQLTVIIRVRGTLLTPKSIINNNPTAGNRFTLFCSALDGSTSGVSCQISKAAGGTWTTYASTNNNASLLTDIQGGVVLALTVDLGAGVAHHYLNGVELTKTVFNTPTDSGTFTNANRLYIGRSDGLQCWNGAAWAFTRGFDEILSAGDIALASRNSLLV